MGDGATDVAVAPVLPTPGGHRPASPRSAGGTCRSPAASGPSGCGPTASGRSRTASSSWSTPATSRTSGSPPGPRRAATGRSGSCSTAPFPFLDSDVYKWLEARRLGARAGRRTPASRRWPTRRSTLVAAAQRADGYLNTFVQVLAPGREYRDLQLGPRAVLHRPPRSRRRSRGIGRSATTGCSRRAARRPTPSTRALGPDGATAIDGHPEIEMALVELYRVTGRAPATSSCARLHRPSRPRPARARTVRRRVLAGPRSRSARRAAVAGHAVRQLYLDAGAVDVAVETGDAALLDAVARAAGATWSRRGPT